MKQRNEQQQQTGYQNLPAAGPTTDGGQGRDALKDSLAGRSYGEQEALLKPKADDLETEGPAADDDTYSKLPANTRGGFTARVLKAAGRTESPAQFLGGSAYQRVITRAEAAGVIGRVLGFGDVLKGQPGVYNDVPLSHWGAAAIYRCREEGIFAGVGQNQFLPDSPLQPDQASALVTRVSNPQARVAFDRGAAVGESEQSRPMGVGNGQTPGSITDPKMRDVYEENRAALGNTQLNLKGYEGEAQAFLKVWEANKGRYERVAERTGIPAKLIAALHFRESSGNFNTYLHQGDPLGKPPVHWPTNIPTFYNWEDAAVHALQMKSGIRKDLALTSDSGDLAAMATFAEYYNGLGYHNRGRVSPYVFSGTNQYQKGKYVADGVYDPNTKDRQLGVVSMLALADGGTLATGTPFEGQVAKAGAPVANAEVKIVDAKGRAYTARTNKNGFFSIAGGLPEGAYKVDVWGVTQNVQLAKGKPGWVALDVTSAQAPEQNPTQPNETLPSQGPEGPGEQDNKPQTDTTPDEPGGFAESLGEEILRRGDKGPLVRVMQQRLIAHGAKIVADGEFGPATAAALLAFQAARGLEVDAQCGADTARALMQAPSGAGAGTLLYMRELKQGAAGVEVRELQQRLNQTGCTLVVDGEFGPATAQAVRQFQKAQGLEVDGVVGSNTARALLAATGANTERPQVKPQPKPTPQPSQPTPEPNAPPQPNPNDKPPVQEPVGYIELHGMRIGPIGGSYQGRPRAAILQERLAKIGADDLAKAELRIEGTTYVIHVGNTQFDITPADVAANPGVFKESADRYKAVAAHFLTQMGAPVPKESLREERGRAAAKSARIEYTAGVAEHGADNSWETWGTNQGPRVNKIKAANRAGGSNTYEWCGMFVGYHYSRVGIRQEILKNLVFWSGLRLHQFFTKGTYVATSQARAGSWWQPHQGVQIGSATGSARKKLLDGFNPQPGDVVLFRSDYSHVGMLVGYDPATGRMDIIEGNRGNRVQATAYGTGAADITYVGRFNDSDFEPGGTVDSDLASAQDPHVKHSSAGGGTT